MTPATQSMLRAIQASDTEALRAALSQGADFDYANGLGHTPLILCIRHRFQVGATMLIRAGADIHRLDNTHSNALQWAAIEEQETVFGLLVDAGANVYHVDEEGEVAMAWAARQGLLASVSKLLDSGFPVDARLGRNKSTALMEAMKCQHLELGVMLVERGADTSLCDATGHSVWYYTFDDQVACLRAATQAGEISRQTPPARRPRGGGRL